MRNICLYFQVHQPFRFRTYRFFDIGHDHQYYDDFSNRSILQKIAKKCYIPTNTLLLELIKKHKGKFKVTFSLTGTFIEQCKMYSPETLRSFQELAATGCVEFLSETYSHSLVALKNEQEFAQQVKAHSLLIEELFGQKPTVFRNTELVYSDKIGEQVFAMGYKTMITEGAKHILGWKSPNYVYCNAKIPKLKLLLRNFKLSDDIAYRFSNQAWAEWPLTAQKYSTWIHDINKKDELINLFMDYETFGEHQWEGSGIFEFLKELPSEVLSKKQFAFSTPSEVSAKYEPMAVLNVEHPISWADEERDLTAWLGNNLQREAFDNLYKLVDDVALIDDKSIKQDWYNLQTSDHFYYMCTKYFSDGAVHQYFNPFESPYDAFINYMNILSDFTERVKKAPKRALTAVQETAIVATKTVKVKKQPTPKVEKAIEKKKK